ncbi:DUF7221 family queuine tRNA-ribosyltransferase-like protein [Amycolatopsis carbonis]|uniref:deazapurine DNA modification protein DpdA family protein n=1 Tax=Amycolatopsis carbonis TaxID=715471 RepID=UPI003DA75E3D
MRALHARGLSLHCFGVKTSGLARYGDRIASSDSAAWSFSGRYVPGCTPRPIAASPTACATHWTGTPVCTAPSPSAPRHRSTRHGAAAQQTGATTSAPPSRRRGSVRPSARRRCASRPVREGARG